MMCIRSVLSLLVVILSFASTPAFSDYAPPHTWELIGASDLIVEGTIEGLGWDTYRVEISPVIAGECSKDVIKIRKFEDWTCGRRWTSYEKGQTALFFLREEGGPFGKTYSVIGGGNEGEWPTDGSNTVYYKNNYSGREEGVPGAVDEIHLVHGTPMGSLKLEKDSIVESIRDFRKCFEINIDSTKPWFHRDYYRLKRLCDDRALDEFLDASPFNRFLVESMREHLAARE